MKTLHVIKHTLILSFAAACFAFAPATATAHTQAAPLAAEYPQKLDKGDKNTRGEKINKPAKRKKVKKQRTNHGPRKPLFPQVHRQSDPLSRVSFKDTYKNRH